MRKTIAKDVENGYAAKLSASEVKDLDAAFLNLFAAVQTQMGERPARQKPRGVDDAALAGVNEPSVCLLYSKIDPHGIEAATSAAQLAMDAHRAYTRPYTQFSLDHENAYRQIRGGEGVNVYCRVVVSLGASGEFVYHKKKALSFGEAASVVHYNRTARLFARVSARLLPLPSLRCFDGFHCAVRKGDAQQAEADFLHLERLRGFELADEKGKRGREIVYLGAEIRLLDGTVRGAGEQLAVEVGLSENRTANLREYIHDIRLSERMDPRTPKKLAGRLSWATSACLSRAGRAVIKSIYLRASKSRTSSNWSLPGSLREVLLWCETNLAKLGRPRVVLSPDDRPTFCYTDASAFGLGIITFRSKNWSTAPSEKVPRDSAAIAVLECRALRVADEALAKSLRFQGKRMVIVVDSNRALGLTLRGQSVTRCMNDDIRRIWAAASCLGELILERVSSDGNPADSPPRMRLGQSKFTGEVDVERTARPFAQRISG